MPLVDIRVDLPAYSTTLNVSLDSQVSVFELKQEIQRTCAGQPRPEGQRLIWRGRILADNEKINDLWQSEPRIVHLAVHPSAWSSTPPEISSSSPPAAEEIMPMSSQSLPVITPRMQFTPEQLAPRPLAFILFKHQEALSKLSTSIAPPLPLPNFDMARATAVARLERERWIWPIILDEPYPPHLSESGLLYEYKLVSGQPYLSLVKSTSHPTALQLHALRVLSTTFAILSLPTLSPTPTIRTVESREVPVPPHVNQLLQQLGLPPLRAANRNGAPPNINPNLPAAPEIREIHIRPLLAPLMMLIFRTTLLLYFVTPARKPIFGLLILAWMLYEIWQPIRNGLRNGWNRDNQQRQANGQPAQQNQNPPPFNGAAPPNPFNRPPLGTTALNVQATALIDRLANLNIEEEERIINETPGISTAEPGFGHKVLTFMGLLVTSLHPAIWNRRRVALRRREGTIRTEANIRNAPLEDSDTEDPASQQRARLQEELRERFSHRPHWIQRYTDRVVAEDWVDDSD